MFLPHMHWNICFQGLQVSFSSFISCTSFSTWDTQPIVWYTCFCINRLDVVTEKNELKKERIKRPHMKPQATIWETNELEKCR